MAKKDPKTNPKRDAIFALDPIAISIADGYEKDEYDAEEKMSKSETNPTTSDQSHLGVILKSLKMHSEQQQQRMAFEIDPHSNKTAFGAIYRHKIGLTPDHILKRIAGPQGDDLVNQILQARSNIISSFGRPRTSRFDIGFEFQEINEEDEDTNEDKIQENKDRLERMKEIMWNCGFRGLDEDWHPNLGQFMKMITRDGLTYGRFAVERIYTVDPSTQKEVLHSFRPVDAGTIFRIIPSQSRDKTRRKQALALLEQIKNKKFDTEKYDKDEYKWVQAINGNPVQLFTDKELIVYNLYPTTNVEFNGYPLTPIDQALNAIATHINITLHNKLFFEHGRAARGMLVFKSDDIDQNTIQRIRLQFHQSINSVQNCLHGSSTIWTKEKGQISLEDYLSGLKEKSANIWTGTEWATGLVYKTGEKRLIETHMRNGIVLKTSPDHRFRVLSENGEPVWKEQRDLVVGDYVLANRKNPVVDELPNKVVFVQNKNINDRLPRSTIVHYCKEIQKFDKVSGNLTKSQRQSISDIISRDTCSRPRLIRYMEAANYPIPSHLVDYHLEDIVKIVDTEEMVPMFDVSINTEDHMFVSNGFCLHNSWRMPVFAVGSEDDVTWQSIDVSGRDKEFQFLSDDNARVILGAFQISPEELPGYAHLSRGTNTQALSESDNEYQLTAARDVGLRPLMYDIQDFFNSHIIPKFDMELSKTHQMVLAGLEHDSPEREAQRLGQDAALHMTYDEILEKVEKKLIGPEMGGNLPLNQQWQMAVSPYLTVGQIMENFFGVKGAAKDPRFNYFRDPFYLQWQQLLMQKAQMAMQQQMAMMQQQMGVPPAGGGGEPQGEQGEQEDSGEAPPQDQAPPQGASEEESAQIQQENAQKREAWLNANYERLNKSINHNHSMLSKMILKRHAEIADRQMEEWRKDSQQAIEKIVRAAKGELEE